MKRAYASLWLLSLVLIGLGQARADECTLSIADVAFGEISPVADTAITATSTVSVTCTWSSTNLLRNVKVCLNLDTGDASSSSVPRSMANGSNLLNYNLYTDSAYSTVWGSIFSSSATTPIEMTLSSSYSLSTTSATGTATIYAQIPSAQTTVPTEDNSSTVYSESFSGYATLDYVYYGSVSQSCSSSIAYLETDFSFEVTATVINDCNITTTPLDFGSSSLLEGALSATASIQVQCTNGDAYKVALDGGNSGDVSSRQMIGANSGESITYQLYLDSDTAAGTGSGEEQSLTVYGLVPEQTEAAPTPDSYSDTINATVYF
jgi:spore coat protein U-like protein